MRAPTAQFAVLRRLLAAECGLAALVTALAVLVIGVPPWAIALLGACALATTTAILVADRMERRRPGE